MAKEVRLNIRPYQCDIRNNELPKAIINSGYVFLAVFIHSLSHASMLARNAAFFQNQAHKRSKPLAFVIANF
jgi:hypothetical protein